MMLFLIIAIILFVGIIYMVMEAVNLHKKRKQILDFISALTVGEEIKVANLPYLKCFSVDTTAVSGVTTRIYSVLDNGKILWIKTSNDLVEEVHY